MDKDLIEETIKQRKKMPKELKSELSNSILANTIFFMSMTIITLIVNIMYNKFNLTEFSNYIKIIQAIVCFVSIGIFEYSYRKDSFSKALYGIEFVIFSIAILYVPYMYVLNSRINFLDIIIKIFFVYYIIKSIFIIIYKRNKYLKENISDVKEIVKEEPKKGYIDEESNKTLNKKKK